MRVHTDQFWGHDVRLNFLKIGVKSLHLFFSRDSMWTNSTNMKTWRCCSDSTCSEVDHRGGACCDGIHLGMDLMFGLIHLVFAPGLGCLKQRKKKIKHAEWSAWYFYHISSQINPLGISVQEFNLTASVPSGGRVSKSSREAWAAWTACILELMVPVRACCAEVCGHTKILSLVWPN